MRTTKDPVIPSTFLIGWRLVFDIFACGTGAAHGFSIRCYGTGPLNYFHLYSTDNGVCRVLPIFSNTKTFVKQASQI